jgi:amino acid transporter
MAFVGGYTVFLPGRWDTPSFLFSYAMIMVVPILFVFWKLKNKTKVNRAAFTFPFLWLSFSFSQWQPLETMTFFKEEIMIVDHYEAELKSKLAR